MVDPMIAPPPDFDTYIATYPDFPKPGILFRDISPLLASPDAMSLAMDAFAAALADTPVDVIAGIESRGFLFSTLLAARLGVGSMMIRKPGKLPGELVQVSYELEYGQSELTIQKKAPVAGRSVLLIDDLLATGGTVVAARQLIESGGGTVSAVAVVIELTALGGRAAVGVPVVALKSYD